MDIAESIKASWAAVQASGVPGHVQEVAFREALRALLAPETSRTTGVTAGQPVRHSSAASGSEAESVVGTLDVSDEAGVMSAVAEETGVPVRRLEQLFHIDDGAVRFVGTSAKFGGSTAEKARTIALLVTVIRRVGMKQSDTSFEILRDACDAMHAYDSKNFKTNHMPKVDGCVVKGEKSNRRLEARGTAISAFAGVVDGILGSK